MRQLLLALMSLTLFACASTPEAPSTAEVEEELAALKKQAAESDAADPEKARICGVHACRGATSIKLKLASGDVLTRNFSWFNPVVQDGSITILPGEELFIEAEPVGSQLVNLRQVHKNTRPEKTLVLKFWQAGDGIDMMLSVNNPFSRALKYQLARIDTEHDALQKTSSCPVKPHQTAFEHWNEPQVQLVLMNPTLHAPGSAVLCEF